MYQIKENYLTINKYSRPGKKLNKVKGIVIHWVANARTSANGNRNFFENRKEGKTGYGSAHFIIDLDGSVMLVLPEDEMAYHVGANRYMDEAVKKLSEYPNDCTLGIECTHLSDNGRMSKQTDETLVKLITDLMYKYMLDPEKDLYLHFDITGKDCHKWFVDNSDEWDNLKKRVAEGIKSKEPFVNG